MGTYRSVCSHGRTDTEDSFRRMVIVSSSNGRGISRRRSLEELLTILRVRYSLHQVGSDEKEIDTLLFVVRFINTVQRQLKNLGVQG